MGIVKISDELHEEIRKASTAMVRSINSQAEYWIKMGMLAEINPTMTYSELLREQLRHAAVELAEPVQPTLSKVVNG
ncbi:MAG: ParD-like family protein [Cellvibrio sp.]|uniref:ParD-like family protein n=1 Tax=Cellvibrio sp. TaxID=1965322 RepID=UPI0031A7969B